METFFDLSQSKMCLLLALFPRPHTLREATINALLSILYWDKTEGYCDPLHCSIV